MSFVYLTGGIHNRRKLISSSKKTRPTSQIVREAVFNMIKVDGVVLDLFSGSGLYGFESLSRGANFVYFNDVDRDAYNSILKNAKTLKETDKCLVSKLDYQVFLKKHEQTHFDYIFIDPPYDFDDATIARLLKTLKHYKATLILERSKQSISPEIEGLIRYKEKVYGIKKITLYKPNNKA